MSAIPLARRRGHAVNRAGWSAALRLIPDSGNLTEFVAAVAVHRGRPITVVDCDLPPDAPSGLWLQYAEVDYIVCVSSVAAGHRSVVICHEIAHMMLGHRPLVGLVGLPAIAPSIALDVASRFFHRQGYQDATEAGAEALATVLAAELAERASSALAASARIQNNVSARLR